MPHPMLQKIEHYIFQFEKEKDKGSHQIYLKYLFMDNNNVIKIRSRFTKAIAQSNSICPHSYICNWILKTSKMGIVIPNSDWNEAFLHGNPLEIY